MGFLNINNGFINFIDEFHIFSAEVPYIVFGSSNPIFYIYNSRNKN